MQFVFWLSYVDPLPCVGVYKLTNTPFTFTNLKRELGPVLMKTVLTSWESISQAARCPDTWIASVSPIIASCARCVSKHRPVARQKPGLHCIVRQRAKAIHARACRVRPHMPLPTPVSETLTYRHTDAESLHYVLHPVPDHLPRVPTLITGGPGSLEDVGSQDAYFSEGIRARSGATVMQRVDVCAPDA